MPPPASRSSRGCGRSGSSRTTIGRAGALCRRRACGSPVNDASASRTSPGSARRQRERDHDRRAIRVRDDEALGGPPVEQRQMGGVHLGNEERYVRLHPEGGRVADHRVARLRELRLHLAADVRGEAREDHVAIERWARRPDDEPAHISRHLPRQPPRARLAICLPDRAVGRGERGHDELRVALQQLHEALAHRAGGREDADPDPVTRAGHLSASSSRVAVSVRASRYFTMTGAYSERPDPPANFPGAARAPGTTTAPAGISSDPPGGRWYTCSRTRSNTGVEPVSTVPAASTARSRTIVPSYTPQPPPTSTSSSMITGTAPTGSSTPPIWAAAERCTRFPICAHEPTSAWLSIMVPSSTYAPTFTNTGGMHTTPQATWLPSR